MFGLMPAVSTEAYSTSRMKATMRRMISRAQSALRALASADMRHGSAGMAVLSSLSSLAVEIRPDWIVPVSRERR